MLRISSLVLTLAVGLAITGTASGGADQMACGPRSHILQLLDDRYGETRRQTGWVSGDGIVEIYVSDSSGSWTLTLTRPMGQTCLVASGHGASPHPTRLAVAEQGA